MDIIQKRFDQLEQDAKSIADGKTTRTGCIDYPTFAGGPTPVPPQIPDVDRNLLAQWRTSVLSLLERVFGRDSSTFNRFQSAVNVKGSYNENYVERFQYEWAIFSSAKSDYEGGYLFNVRNLVHSEVFADELEQAAHFLDSGGYKVPAAVIAGTVLEVTLRNLCDQRPGLSKDGSLNKMNDDLAKHGAYNKMRTDQIRAWAKIRNSAAHGEPDEFDASDVARMIEGIRDFVAAHVK